MICDKSGIEDGFSFGATLREHFSTLKSMETDVGVSHERQHRIDIIFGSNHVPFAAVESTINVCFCKEYNNSEKQNKCHTRVLALSL